MARKEYLEEHGLPLIVPEDIKYIVLRYCYWKGAKKKLANKRLFSQDRTVKLPLEPLNRTETVNIFGIILYVEMSELIAFSETRFLIGYMGSRMQRMYADLFSDIKHKNEVNHEFSDGYDLVQECALYLCEHYGKHLTDIISYTKKGKKITIRIACVKQMMKLINRKTSDNYRSISIEDLTPSDEPWTELKEETTQDYTLVDNIMASLNLTDNMRVALECRMTGLSYPKIGQILERSLSTVYEYFINMRQRYTAIYG